MHKMDRRTFLRKIAVGAAASVVAPLGCMKAKGSGKRPNIVLIVGDDIGFSDIGCYGSEIKTPNLDKLAANGIRFTQFYNMAKCNPTRSSLFTGLFLPRENAENAQAFPTVLRQAGYFTAMSGKEHFDDWVPKRCYAEHCFDESLTFWANNEYFIPPSGKFKQPFKKNGKEIPISQIPVNEPPFYKTDVLTDYALKYLDLAKEKNKPFFLYLPYNAAHYPLQARKKDIAKYRGTYKKGWDKVREARYKRQESLGVIPDGCKLSPPEDNINKFRGPYRGNIYKYRPWDSLPEKRKRRTGSGNGCVCRYCGSYGSKYRTGDSKTKRKWRPGKHPDFVFF